MQCEFSLKSAENVNPTVGVFARHGVFQTLSFENNTRAISDSIRYDTSDTKVISLVIGQGPGPARLHNLLVFLGACAVVLVKSQGL